MSAVFWGAADPTIAGLAASTTRFSPVASGLPTMLRTTEAQAQVPIRGTGSILRGFVRVNTGNRTIGSFTLRKNATDTAITVVFNAAGTYTVDAVVPFADGDLMSYAFFGGVTGAANYAFIACGIVVDMNGRHVTRMASGGDTAGTFSAASATAVVCIGGEMAQALSGNETRLQIILHGSGRIRNLALYIASNARSTTSTVAVRLNAAASALSVSIAGGVTTSPVEDTSDVVTFADGDAFSVGVALGSGAGAITFQWITFDIESDDGRAYYVAAINNGATLAANLTRFIVPYGTLTFATTEAAAIVRMGYAGAASRLGIAFVSSSLNTGTLKEYINGGVDGLFQNAPLTGGPGAAGVGWAEDAVAGALHPFVDVDDWTLRALSGSTGTSVITAILTEVKGVRFGFPFPPRGPAATHMLMR